MKRDWSTWIDLLFFFFSFRFFLLSVSPRPRAPLTKNAIFVFFHTISHNFLYFLREIGLGPVLKYQYYMVRFGNDHKNIETRISVFL